MFSDLADVLRSEKNKSDEKLIKATGNLQDLEKDFSKLLQGKLEEAEKRFNGKLEVYFYYL